MEGMPSAYSSCKSDRLASWLLPQTSYYLLQLLPAMAKLEGMVGDIDNPTLHVFLSHFWCARCHSCCWRFFLWSGFYPTFAICWREAFNIQGLLLVLLCKQYCAFVKVSTDCALIWLLVILLLLSAILPMIPMSTCLTIPEISVSMSFDCFTVCGCSLECQVSVLWTIVTVYHPLSLTHEEHHINPFMREDYCPYFKWRMAS